MQRFHMEAAIFGLYHSSERGGRYFSDVEGDTKTRIESCHLIELLPVILLCFNKFNIVKGYIFK